MPLARRPVVQSRFARRNLDPALPLYVLRRIPAGADAAGAPIVLLPGARLDTAAIDSRRLGFMYRNRMIGHELPRGLRPIEPTPDVVALTAVETPPEPVAKPAPKPQGKPRAGA